MTYTIKRDPKSGKIIDAGREETGTVSVRLPKSVIEQLNRYPDKSDFLRGIILDAVESRSNG